MKKFKAIFAGGGTGGHLTPALAIAEGLKAKLNDKYETEFLFVGTKRGIEYRKRESLGYPLALINMRGISRSLSLANLLFPFLLIGAVLKSMSLIGSFKPHVVIGTGGYVMGPVILAAWLKGCPRVIQEQNSFPGLATRKLGRLADRVFLGFGEAEQYFAKKDILVESGNPVRSVIGTISKDEGRNSFGLDHARKTIMIMGGSQGAANINKNIITHLDTLGDDYQLIWQTGERDYKDVTALACAGGRVTGRSLFPYSDRMEMAYAAADIIIARAGALTLAEIAAAGLPAILVPYPYATGDHQLKNAVTFAEKGAAVIVRDSDLGKVNLLSRATELLKGGDLEKMAKASAAMHLKNGRRAVDIICENILGIAALDKE